VLDKVELALILSHPHSGICVSIKVPRLYTTVHSMYCSKSVLPCCVL